LDEPLGDKTQALNAISSVPGVITFGNPKTDKNNVAPRIGFAYDPWGKGRLGSGRLRYLLMAGSSRTSRYYIATADTKVRSTRPQRAA